MYGKYWILTANNQTVEWFRNIVEKRKTVIGAVYQLEKGKKGTKHIQGWIKLANSYKFDRVINMFKKKAHIERCINIEQSKEYCQKEDSRIEGPFEYGDIDTGVFGSLKRKKTDRILDLIDDGLSFKELANDHELRSTYINKYRAFQHYKEIKSWERSEQTELIVYYGVTGTGKTTKVMEYLKEKGIVGYWKDPNTKWWDCYDNEEVVVIDDFMPDTSQITLGYLVQLINKCPIRVEVKGGFKEFNSRQVIITTNINPDNWYSEPFHKKEHIDAMKRRITKTIECIRGPLDEYVYK